MKLESLLLRIVSYMLILINEIEQRAKIIFLSASEEIRLLNILTIYDFLLDSSNTVHCFYIMFVLSVIFLTKPMKTKKK